jgi:hypothetical protein
VESEEKKQRKCNEIYFILGEENIFTVFPSID